MADRISHDDDDLWRGAGKVLALNIVVDGMLQQMKNAKIQYAHAFGLNPDDEVSVQGRKNYKPRETAGFSFWINMKALIGQDGDAVRTAAQILGNSDDEATEVASHGRRN